MWRARRLSEIRYEQRPLVIKTFPNRGSRLSPVSRFCLLRSLLHSFMFCMKPADNLLCASIPEAIFMFASGA